MGVLFDYFSAASDEEAASVIDRVGGPGSQATIAPPAEPRRGIFGRKRQPAAVTYQEAAVFDTVSGNVLIPLCSWEHWKSCSPDGPSTMSWTIHGAGKPSRIGMVGSVL